MHVITASQGRGPLPGVKVRYGNPSLGTSGGRFELKHRQQFHRSSFVGTSLEFKNLVLM